MENEEVCRKNFSSAYLYIAVNTETHKCVEKVKRGITCDKPLSGWLITAERIEEEAGIPFPYLIWNWDMRTSFVLELVLKYRITPHL